MSALRRCGATPADLRAILGGNALDLFGLAASAGETVKEEVGIVARGAGEDSPCPALAAAAGPR